MPTVGSTVEAGLLCPVSVSLIRPGDPVVEVLPAAAPGCPAVRQRIWDGVLDEAPGGAVPVVMHRWAAEGLAAQRCSAGSAFLSALLTACRAAGVDLSAEQPVIPRVHWQQHLARSRRQVLLERGWKLDRTRLEQYDLPDHPGEKLGQAESSCRSPDARVVLSFGAFQVEFAEGSPEERAASARAYLRSRALEALMVRVPGSGQPLESMDLQGLARLLGAVVSG